MARTWTENPAGATPPAQPAPVAARLRGAARWKLTEPVRLYLYSVVVVLVAGLSLAGYLTGEWQAYATAAAAVVLGIAPAVEAARASAYSPRGAVQAVHDALATPGE